MTDMLRVMAIDHGLANIGIALSDPLRIIAKPHLILKHINRDADFTAIAEIAQLNEVGRVVIGIPTTTGGGLSRQAVVVVEWGCKLERFLNLPVFGWDESYTSVTAGAIAGKNRAKQSP